MNDPFDLKHPKPAALPLGSGAGEARPTTEDKPEIPTTLPILPLRGAVVFPGTLVPITIRRAASLRLLDETLPHSKLIGLVAQRDEAVEEPRPEDLYRIGVAATVLKLLRQPDQSAIVVVQGVARVGLTRFTESEPFLRAEVRELATLPPEVDDSAWQAEIKNLRENAARLLELTPEIPEQVRLALSNLEEPEGLIDFLASHLNVDFKEKQALLEELDLRQRATAVQTRVARLLEIAQLQQKLQKDVASRFSDAERRAWLREQARAIQRELGEEDDGAQEQIANLKQRLEEASPPAEVLATATKELQRLNVIPPASPEYAVIVSYVETIADLPWARSSEEHLDLKAARATLDRDHFDLDKVKRRLIEYLAVRKLNPQNRGPILCLVGPPGVGKTSLGESVAEALGRKFSRLSLGGIRDEAEIRGHRRTYIGAMPGRIIQELRRVGTRNPVMMLDELDKIGADFRGDPASALLEVLDPRQNHAFVDRYLDLPFDLSQILFIATANYLDPVPAPLRDRMEVLEIPGYTEREKAAIAQRYLVRRQLAENGLTAEQCAWSEAAVLAVINDYTHEAGVRELERQISAVCRAIAARVAEGEPGPFEITPEQVAQTLGPARYIRETRLQTNRPGVVIGLAYTPVGGEILYIEAARYPGKGGLTLTGQIGNVMRESAQAAMSLLRTRAGQLGIGPEAFAESDLHVHVPAGAIPKDGPSAGVAMFTALASLFLEKPVPAEVAMTGEITLRGLVLPIGGLKEKSLAALRAGVKTILIPKLNARDLPDLPPEVQESIRFVPVETVDDLLAAAGLR